MLENENITRLLREGNSQALEELFPIVYGELREIAAALFRNEYRANHTLQPTALVHDAYLRLVGNENGISWQNRAHFFGIAARSMRQILVNHAEARNAEKRGGKQTIVALDEAVNFLSTQDIEILALHEALEKISALDRRQAEIVELKFFGGLKNEEIAEVLQISVSTITREWEMARTWLYRELKK
jgi:RNA polymerase sigma factor (TIGR02999 family)